MRGSEKPLHCPVGSPTHHSCPSAVERNYIKRIVAVACWLERHVVTQARSDDEAVLQELRAGIDKLTVRTHHARMDPEDVTEWRAVSRESTGSTRASLR